MAMRPRLSDRSLRAAGLALAAIGLTSSASGAATDLQEATRADVRCVVADAYIADETDDPQLQTLFLSAGIFYMGRINARDPKADFRTLVVEESGRMDASRLEVESRRCMRGVETMGKMSEDMDLVWDEIDESMPVRGLPTRLHPPALRRISTR
jgi:hypothetical protein